MTQARKGGRGPGGGGQGKKAQAERSPGAGTSSRALAPSQPASTLPFSLTDPPLRPEVLAAMEEVRAARAGLGPTIDQAVDSARAAVDIKRQIRRHPGRAAAIAGGAGFVALGGPGRVLRSIGRRLPGRKRDPYDGLLPSEIRRVLRDSGAPREEALEQALEADFARYLRDKGRAETARPRLASSVWRTYDTLVGPVGNIAMRYAERAVSSRPPAPPSRPRPPGSSTTGEGSQESGPRR